MVNIALIHKGVLVLLLCTQPVILEAGMGIKRMTMECAEPYYIQ